MGRRHGRTGVLVALGVLSGTVGLAGPVGPGYAGAGRHRPDHVDGADASGQHTRLGPPIPAGVDTPLPSGLLSVAAKPRVGSSGEVDVFPCGGPLDAEPTFRLDDAFVTRSIVAPANTSMCLRSSVAVDLSVDVLGNVAGVPFAGGLQYEPLNVPSLIIATGFDDPGFAGVTRVLPRGRFRPLRQERRTPSTSGRTDPSRSPCTTATNRRSPVSPTHRPPTPASVSALPMSGSRPVSSRA